MAEKPIFDFDLFISVNFHWQILAVVNREISFLTKFINILHNLQYHLIKKKKNHICKRFNPNINFNVE